MAAARKSRRPGRARAAIAASGSPARRDRWMLLLLAVAVLLCFGRVAGFGFIDYDDEQYVYGNPMVTAGLTARGVAWAWTSFASYNWHPLTWMSLQADSSFFWPEPAGYHVTNLLLHLTAVGLLYLVLRRGTGRRLPSAAAAALFGLHPLRVEPVAWIAERKDLLAVALGLAAILAYLAYVARPAPFRNALAAFLFALSCAAKPAMVTLPFLLLLLDLWPLGRLRSAGALLPRAREKWPLFALAAASSVMTVLAQRHGGAVQALERFPLPGRLANAVVSLGTYLVKTAWPTGLVPFYPYPLDGVDRWRLLASTGALLAITAWSAATFRRHPHRLVGWLWFVGSLVPMIGLVQVGWQAMADRYMSVPIIGLLMGVAWEAPRLLARLPRAAGIAAVAALVSASGLLAWRQAGRWHDSETLWRYTLAVSPDNELARVNLCVLLGRDPGRAAEAEACYREGLSLLERKSVPKRAHLNIHQNLGVLLVRKGDPTGAIGHFREALRVSPGSVGNWDNLATTHAVAGDPVAAGEAALEALARGFLPKDRFYLQVAGELERSGRGDLSQRLYRAFGDACEAAGRLEDARLARAAAARLAQ
jgi:tetratricopeptide (TPR) repeat protein